MEFEITKREVDDLLACSFEGREKFLPATHPLEPGAARFFKDGIYATTPRFKSGSPRTMYHITPSKNYFDITNNGLKKQMSAWAAKCEPSEEAVSLWERKKEAMDEDSIEQLTPCGDPKRMIDWVDVELFAVDVKGLNTRAIGSIMELNEKFSFVPTEYRAYEDIPSSRLRNIDKIDNSVNIDACLRMMKKEQRDEFYALYEKEYGEEYDERD